MPTITTAILGRIIYHVEIVNGDRSALG